MNAQETEGACAHLGPAPRRDFFYRISHGENASFDPRFWARNEG